MAPVTVMASPDHVACDLDHETVILSLKNGEYYGLNAVAAAIWKMLHGRRTIAQICDALLQQFSGVTPEQCEADVVRMVDELAQLGLVEVS